MLEKYLVDPLDLFHKLLGAILSTVLRLALLFVGGVLGAWLALKLITNYMM